jgi:hypothetical protein
MNKLLLAFAGFVVASAQLLGATEVHAQTCLKIGATAGDQVRLDTGSVSAFWFQNMDLTVKSFNEFAELQSNPGGDFCGIVRVQISGNLVSGGMGQNEILLLVDTSLRPGTRLRLVEFVYTGSNLDRCEDVGPLDPCMWNAFLFRTATVGNR